MAIHLKHFTRDELILTNVKAAAILHFFRPDKVFLPSSLSDEAISFAQGMLVEAIDASYHMGFVEILYKIAGKMTVPQSFSEIKDMVVEFAKEAAKHWFKHATEGNLVDPKIYENVRKTLANNFQTVFESLNYGPDMDIIY